jgi:hypothetical protein
MFLNHEEKQEDVFYGAVLICKPKRGLTQLNTIQGFLDINN